MNDPVEDAPVTKYVNHMLRSAVGQGAETIHFERQLDTQGKTKAFGYMMEIDGARGDFSMVPAALWEHVISRLKVMARLIDYGLNQSESGEFEIQLGDGRTAEFQITSNPNPHTDTKVTLINKSIGDVKSDEYKALKETFLNAALPTDLTALEHTFGWFLQRFGQSFEDRLIKRISNDGMIALRQASLDELHDKNGDRGKFAEAMELVAQQTSINDFTAAGVSVTEAYEELHARRRRRYEAILAGLTDIDRAAVRANYLNKVSLTIEPSRSEPDRQEVVLAIDFPGKKTQRIERRWWYYLANGLPMKKGNEISHGGMIGSSDSFGSRGD